MYDVDVLCFLVLFDLISLMLIEILPTIWNNFNAQELIFSLGALLHHMEPEGALHVCVQFMWSETLPSIKFIYNVCRWKT